MDTLCILQWLETGWGGHPTSCNKLDADATRNPHVFLPKVNLDVCHKSHLVICLMYWYFVRWHGTEHECICTFAVATTIISHIQSYLPGLVLNRVICFMKGTDIWVIEKGPGSKGPNKQAVHPTWLTVRAGLHILAAMAGVYHDDSRPPSIPPNDAWCMVPEKWLKDPDCRSNMCRHNYWGDQVTLCWGQGHEWGRGQFGKLVLRCEKR